jgi:glutaconate CoA-transferase subunit B
LVGIGAYPRTTVRWPGSFGAAHLYFLVPRVILFREEHSARVLVPKVDFISAPGASPDNLYRPGGPYALVTGLCVFEFDRPRRRFRLASLHPGHTIDEVRANTGFTFDAPKSVPPTAAPDAESLALIRDSVGREIAEVYPQFASRLAASIVR